jgi:hypothetical protein
MVTGSGEVEVVVVQVPPPAPTGPAAPTHCVTEMVEGAVAVMVPLLSVTKLLIVMVQAIP